MEYPGYVLYSDKDHHDPEGIIFIRRESTSLEALAEGRVDVSWFRAGALSLNPLELYVRMYASDADRTPTHYIRLDIIEDMLGYFNFCTDNHLNTKPTYDYFLEISLAIQELEDIFTDAG